MLNGDLLDAELERLREALLFSQKAVRAVLTAQKLDIPVSGRPIRNWKHHCVTQQRTRGI